MAQIVKPEAEMTRNGGQVAGDWLSGAINEGGWPRSLAAGLLRLLGRQRIFTGTWRLRVIQLALASPDIELRDAGVQAAESWGDPEPPPDGGIRAVVLALATGADRIDRMDLVWVEDDALRANGIALNPSEGRTPVASLRGQHVDLIRLDLGRLATVATLVAGCPDSVPAAPFYQKGGYRDRR